MKRKLSIFAVILFFASINTGMASIESNNTIDSSSRSCFSYYHDFFHDNMGGITLDNLGLFNRLASTCQLTYE